MEKVKAGRETGYGAGVLFICPATGRCLFVKRSSQGDHPGTWCTSGGGVENNETIEQAVRRECVEELGYDGDYELHHMDRQDHGGFVFHNHFAAVPEEFTPVLNDEHTDYVWTDKFPEPMHPGLEQAITNFVNRSEA